MNRALFTSFALAFSVVAAGIGCSAATDDVDTTESSLEHRPGLTRDGSDGGAADLEGADGGADELAALRDQVQTLLSSKCAPCHTDRASAGLSVLDFAAQTVDVPSTQLPTMNRLTPKDRESSYLLHKVKGTHTTVGGQGRQMPPNGALTDEEVELIGAFVDAL